MNRTLFATTATMVAALAASVTLVACQRVADTPAPSTQTPPATSPATSSSETARTGPEVVSDAAITVAVNTALASDDGLSALRIDVDTVDGRVQLNGQAPDAAARERASSLARAVDGVKSVDNRLVLPPA